LGEVPGPAVFKIAEMNAQQCRRAIEAIELLVKPKRSRWDHMRLDALLEGEA
jgi:hypothetical protein